MTSISATSSSNYQSPLQQLQAELQSEVNSGAVSSSDQSALSSALTDINSSLQSGASASSSTSNTSPGDIQSKINSLIQGEVSSGKLTADQATELQGVFQNAFANGPGSTGGTARCFRRSRYSRRVRRTRRCRWTAPGWSRRRGRRSPWPSRWPRRRIIRQRFVIRQQQSVIDQQHQQLIEQQFGDDCASAVSPVIAGFAVVLVIDLLQRDRKHRQRRQLVLFGAADQLPNLISSQFPRRRTHGAQGDYSSQKGKDDCRYWALACWNPFTIGTLIRCINP